MVKVVKTVFSTSQNSSRRVKTRRVKAKSSLVKVDQQLSKISKNLIKTRRRRRLVAHGLWCRQAANPSRVGRE